MTRKQIEEYLDNKYGEFLARSRQWALQAETPEAYAAAIGGYKAVEDMRAREFEFLLKQKEVNKQCLMQAAVAAMNLASTGVKAGTSLYAMKQGFMLEHDEHGVMSFSGTKAAWKNCIDMNK